MKLYEFFGAPTNKEESNDMRDNMSGKTQADDDKLADDVYWFILDDDELHKEMFLPLAKEIAAKQKEDDFDHGKYAKKWLPMVNKGCIKYYKKSEHTEDPRDLFTKAMRKGICQRLADQHHTDIEKGEYNPGK